MSIVNSSFKQMRTHVDCLMWHFKIKYPMWNSYLVNFNSIKYLKVK